MGGAQGKDLEGEKEAAGSGQRGVPIGGRGVVQQGSREVVHRARQVERNRGRSREAPHSLCCAPNLHPQ